MSRVLTPTAQALLGMQPPVLRKQALFQACAAAQGEQVDKLNEALDALAGLVIPKSSGDYLILWEAMTGVARDPDATEEERLTVVLAFLSRMGASGSGADWVGIATRLIGTGWTYRTRQAHPFVTKNLLQNPNGNTATTGWSTFSSSGVLTLTSVNDPDFGGDGGMQFDITTNPSGAGTLYLPYANDGTPTTNMRAMLPFHFYALRAKIKITQQFVNASAQLRLQIRGRTAASVPREADVAVTVANMDTFPVGTVIELRGIYQGVSDIAWGGPQITVGHVSGTDGTAIVGELMMSEVQAADSPIPAYGDGSRPGWSWDGTVNDSASTRDDNNPAARNIYVFLGTAQQGLPLEYAQRLFEEISPANQTVTVFPAEGMLLDGGLLDTGLLG